MTLDQFRQTLSNNEPPHNLNNVLTALWYEAKGNWQKAHTIVQSVDTNEAAWVHAYLHRKEPDEFNAGYWYRRAGKDFCRKSFDKEWEEISKELLKSVQINSGE